MKASDYKIAEFIKVVLAGQPGRAKSSAGLTFPTPMMIFDFDNKLEGPILWARKMGIDLSKIDIIQPKHWNNRWEEFDKMLKDYAKNPAPYKTFGFDSLTSMADVLLGFTNDAKSAEKKAKTVAGVQVAGIDEYNAETSGIMDLLLFMKDIKAHVWLTAHVIETKTQVMEAGAANKIIVNRALLTGGKKAAAKIPVYFPENYSIQIEKPIREGDPVDYVCHTRPNEEDYGRTAYPLPAKFKFTNDLFFKILMEHIQKGIGQGA